ncbi:hypothetical protein SAMN03003324_02215 [Pedobacter antarcticus]|nr:hypothetical protein SAMN03003324_02215 [Pedobacter antarcticus]
MIQSYQAIGSENCSMQTNDCLIQTFIEETEVNESVIAALKTLEDSVVETIQHRAYGDV